jgi:hypothetical protein
MDPRSSLLFKQPPNNKNNTLPIEHQKNGKENTYGIKMKKTKTNGKIKEGLVLQNQNQTRKRLNIETKGKKGSRLKPREYIQA